MEPTLEEMLLSDPRLLRAFLEERVVTSLDDQGRAIHNRVPRYTAEDIQTAYGLLNDPNRLRAGMMRGLLDDGRDIGAGAAMIGAADFMPFIGAATGLEDTYQSGRAARDAFGRGEYGEAALEGLLAAVGAGGAALSTLPFVGGIARMVGR